MKTKLYDANLGDYVMDNQGDIYRVLRVLHSQGIIVTKALRKNTPGVTGWNLDGSIEKWPYEDRAMSQHATRKLTGFTEIENHPEYLI